jgi:diketogulonate reductase-like aldo/keto reductase
MTTALSLTLNDGKAIPQLGLGVYQLGPGRETQRAVEAALAAGYRHIDTAAVYRNEGDVGAALRASGLPREEIWVTTKLWNSDHGGDRPLRALEASLERLGVDYVDLYLIHWPVPERLETWSSFVRFRDLGLARSIGVSNFMTRHLNELLAASEVVPAVNQIELSPFLYRSRSDTIEASEAAGIAVEAYSPLTKGRRLGHPALVAVGERHGKTPAQVLIRWCIDKGLVVIPRSRREARIRENAEVLDFSLSAAEIETLDSLDEGLTTGWDPEGER